MFQVGEPQFFQTFGLSKHHLDCISRFVEQEQGQDLIEYALVAALIGLTAVTTLHGLSNRIAASFNTVASNLNSAI